ncbi:MAG: DUF5696 domain-containing protein [Saccharofermentanales bacterium]
MKRKLVSVLLVAILLLASCNPDIADLENAANIQYEELTGYGISEVFASGNLSLIVNFDDLNIIVENTADGKRWATSPEDLDQDTIAGDEYKAYMKSQFEITYIYERNVRTVNSYAESVQNGQYKIYKIDNGIRIEYQLGDMSLTIDDIPRKLSLERADELILGNAALDDEQKGVFLSTYEIEEGTGNYLWKSNNFGSKQKNVIQLFDAIGYSQDDLKSDAAMFGLEISVEEKISFKIPVEYTIKNNRFNISVPAGEIDYPDEYPVLNINLCPFFAAQKNGEEGYIFMPDGSGVLMEFDEEDTRSLSLNIYSNDISIGNPMKPVVSRPVLLPVFGIKSGAAAVLGIIEDGDAISMITAVRAGRNSLYNNAGVSFTVRARDSMDLSGVSTIPADVTVLQKEMYQGNLTLSYTFLSGEEADYSGMAGCYRDYLIASGYFLSTPEDLPADIPLYIETVGAVTANQSFLGFNYKGPVALTTFDQTAGILSDMEAAGIGNVNSRLSGWFNGGADQRAANRIRRIGSLGTAQKLKALLKNGNVFLDIRFLTLSDSSGVSLSRHSARKPDQQYVRTYLDGTDKGYVLSASYLQSLVAAITGGLRTFDGYRISTSDLGNLVCADYSKKNQVDRQAAALMTAENLEILYEASGLMMMNAANIHTARYASHSTDTPFGGSGYYTAAKDIPFYQMVFHGRMNYADYPMNLSSTYENDLLKAAEYGGGISYKFIARDMTTIEGLYDSNLFSASYEVWRDRCVSDYLALRELQENLNNQQIIGHRYLNDICTETLYEDGTKIIVNYSGDSVNITGTVVPAGSAVRVEGK